MVKEVIKEVIKLLNKRKLPVSKFLHVYCSHVYITGCPICLSKTMTDPVTTNCCKQAFCRSCLDKAMLHSCYCPVCKAVLRRVEGNQPYGRMDYYQDSYSLPGYESYGTIRITYSIPSGTQGLEHPNPGLLFASSSYVDYIVLFRCTISWYYSYCLSP